MTGAEKTRLTTRDLAPVLGTAMLADKPALLSGEHAGAIRELLEKRGVLVFPEIHFTDAEQIAFTGAARRAAEHPPHSSRTMPRTKLEGEESFA